MSIRFFMIFLCSVVFVVATPVGAHELPSDELAQSIAAKKKEHARRRLRKWLIGGGVVAGTAALAYAAWRMRQEKERGTKVPQVPVLPALPGLPGKQSDSVPETLFVASADVAAAIQLYENNLAISTSHIVQKTKTILGNDLTRQIDFSSAIPGLCMLPGSVMCGFPDSISECSLCCEPIELLATKCLNNHCEDAWLCKNCFMQRKEERCSVCRMETGWQHIFSDMKACNNFCREQLMLLKATQKTLDGVDFTPGQYWQQLVRLLGFPLNSSLPLETAIGLCKSIPADIAFLTLLKKDTLTLAAQRSHFFSRLIFSTLFHGVSVDDITKANMDPFIGNLYHRYPGAWQAILQRLAITKNLAQAYGENSLKDIQKIYLRDSQEIYQEALEAFKAYLWAVLHDITTEDPWNALKAELLTDVQVQGLATKAFPVIDSLVDLVMNLINSAPLDPVAHAFGVSSLYFKLYTLWLGNENFLKEVAVLSGKDFTPSSTH